MIDKTPKYGTSPAMACLPALRAHNAVRAAKLALAAWAKDQTIDVTIDSEPTHSGRHQKLYARNSEGVVVNTVKWASQ